MAVEVKLGVLALLDVWLDREIAVEVKFLLEGVLALLALLAFGS